jgi:hypothetical protein
LNRLVKACQAAEVKEVKNGQLVRNTDGLTIICGGSRGGETTNPFEIYQTESWLKYKVKTGYVITTGNEIVPTYVETEFTITSGVLRYWFYVEVASGSSTAEIKTSATTLAWDSTKIPLGWIDTQTGAGTEAARIYQIVRDNIIVNGGSFSKIKMFQITSVGNDALTAKEVSLYVGGPVLVEPAKKVARPFKLRRPGFATIDGVTYTYEYTSEQTRTVKVGATTIESQVVVPRYLVGDFIYASELSYEVLASPDATYWTDINADGRAWAKI